MTRFLASAALRRLFSAACAGVALATVFGVSEARADFTFNLGNLFVDDDFNNGNFLLSATLPVGTYTSYEVTTDWTDDFDARSIEAAWELTNASSVVSSSTTYATSDTAIGAAENGDATTLSWSGDFSTPYSNGPLYFIPYQIFSGSSANWSNTIVTLRSINTPTSTSFTLPANGEKFTATGELSPQSVVWYDFVYGGEELTIDTLGSQLTGGADGDNDTELALYDALGTLITTNDQGFDEGSESLLANFSASLTPGDKYYIALGAFDTVFDDDFSVTPSSEASGTFQLNVTNVTNVTVVPEAGSVALLGIGGLLGTTLAARRKKA
ncbi:MAG: hypothetical protein H7Y38_18445 [Armatimonadetes bacterium]|nr:hypothetical protein [Armatimonadota bacterium]